MDRGPIGELHDARGIDGHAVVRDDALAHPEVPAADDPEDGEGPLGRVSAALGRHGLATPDTFPRLRMVADASAPSMACSIFCALRRPASVSSVAALVLSSGAWPFPSSRQTDRGIHACRRLSREAPSNCASRRQRHARRRNRRPAVRPRPRRRRARWCLAPAHVITIRNAVLTAAVRSRPIPPSTPSGPGPAGSHRRDDACRLRGRVHRRRQDLGPGHAPEGELRPARGGPSRPAASARSWWKARLLTFARAAPRQNISGRDLAPSMCRTRRSRTATTAGKGCRGQCRVPADVSNRGLRPSSA